MVRDAVGQERLHELHVPALHPDEHVRALEHRVALDGLALFDQRGRDLVLPVGRLTSEQMRGLAEIAERFGSGTFRLTVWQNLLVSDIPDAQVEAACELLGLDPLYVANEGKLVAIVAPEVADAIARNVS